MGCAAGYVSARLCKLFEGDVERWRKTTLLTAFLFPGLFFSVFFVMNLMIWGEKSSGAVPFTTMFAIVVLWFGISVPLVLMGSRAGYAEPAIDLPVKVQSIPRQIPEQPWSSNPWIAPLVGGILPFGAVFTEVFFMMASIWQHQFYYLFGFAAIVFIVLVITCAEISIALTYFMLTGEDYRWWWNAFLSSGCSAVYLFAYSIVHFYSRLRITKMASIVLYFTYMGVFSVMFFLLTGAVGLAAAFFFLRAIYGSIKVD